MLKVGDKDVFERLHTEKFRLLASRFGEFVSYERDRAARDIGLHLPYKSPSRGEQLSTALCWFQLKGIQSATVPKEQFDQLQSVKISLKVRHLQFWYLQPMPTYLALFVESADTFLVLNLQDYATATWGRGILNLTQDEATVEIRRGSVLDEEAFYTILARSDVEQWAKALGTDSESARLCRRDYDLIWHFGTAGRRRVFHKVRIVDWQSKTRGEIHFEECSKSDKDDCETIRSHWQFMLSARDVEGMYPYLTLYALEEDTWEDEDEWVPRLVLSNGDEIVGSDCAGEYFEYIVGAKLNKLGSQLFKSVQALAKIGLIKINENLDEFISIAPWHHRSV